MKKKKLYFENEDAENCYPEAWFQQKMKEEELKELAVLEANKSKGKEYFYCKTVRLTVFSPAIGCTSPAIGTVSQRLHPIMAAPYTRCSGRILLKEQQVLSDNHHNY